jgi:Flp pilus assembly protein TadG
MKIVRMLRDARAVSAVEFALTAPLFFALLFGMIEGGLLVWTQIGLQHGAEAAARCASINSTLCGTTTNIQNYAAQNAFGLSVDPSTFTVPSSPPPGCNQGKQVSASYAFGFVTSYFGVPSLTLNAQSCFPK